MWTLENSDWSSLIPEKLRANDWHYVQENSEPFTWRLQSPNATILKIEDDGFIPKEDGSINNLGLILAPNRLAMPMFYMLLTEARRVVPAGGNLLIITKVGSSSLLLRLKDFFKQETKALNAEHFTSPEHWQILMHETVASKGLLLGVAIFQRTTFS